MLGSLLAEVAVLRIVVLGAVWIEAVHIQEGVVLRIQGELRDLMDSDQERVFLVEEGDSYRVLVEGFLGSNHTGPGVVGPDCLQWLHLLMRGNFSACVVFSCLHIVR